MKINSKIIGWFVVSLSIVVLSFYLSIIGSKNLATTSILKNDVAQNIVSNQKDSLSIIYDNKKKIYLDDNNALRASNNDLRDKLIQTDVKFRVIRSDYQTNIDKNLKTIDDNQSEINKIDEELKIRVNELKSNLNQNKENNKTEDTGNIVLFVIIAISVELFIILGIYHREKFEYTLFILNKNKFENLFLKKERYKSLLNFVYKNGKNIVGDKIISVISLKEIVKEKSCIINSNKLVQDFFYDMDRLGVFSIQGKRRIISINYDDALKIIDNLDETFHILENMK